MGNGHGNNSYNRIALRSTKVSCSLVCIVTLLGRYLAAKSAAAVTFDFVVISLGILFPSALVAYLAVKHFPSQIEKWSEEAATPIKQWADVCPLKTRQMAIVLVAGVSLFLELALIRWQACLFPVFLLHKNFTLLACFCGLGLGYALTDEGNTLLLPLSLPMLALTIMLLMLLRFGTDYNILSLLQAVPIQQDITMIIFHTGQWNFMSNPLFYTPVCLLLALTFVLNALIFIPIGQFCGCLMRTLDAPLKAYGFNLLGSIAGSILLFVLSWLWAGPVIWFGVAAAILLYYQLTSPRAREMGLICAVLGIVLLAWPVEQMIQTIYSPYQLIERISGTNGLTQILGAGSYIQAVTPFPDSQAMCAPYKMAARKDRVLIAGAGIGNDVQIALDCGAKLVDAVEIDPAIIEIGKASHSLHPYQDPRVHIVVNDARNFFNISNDRYDAIVFGGQDTRILLSHGSNVRMDSFLFTEQGLARAFNLLNPGGSLCTGFALGDATYLGKRIYHMMKNIPGASPPIAVTSKGNEFNSGTLFIVTKGGHSALPENFIEEHNLAYVTAKYALDEDKVISATDEWPFFYMGEKGYPLNYLLSLLLTVLLSLWLTRELLPKQSWNGALMPFFFLGAGFMLVETKGITELGLVFGNTWHVIGITIIGVLTMGYTSNVTVSRNSRIPLPFVFCCLLLVVLLGYYTAAHGGIGDRGISAMAEAVTLLTCPLFFSGIIFSSLLRSTDNVAGAMAYNLLGAMLGGLCEYNALRFGFAFLYLLGLVLYGLAWFSTARFAGR